MGRFRLHSCCPSALTAGAFPSAAASETTKACPIWPLKPRQTWGFGRVSSDFGSFREWIIYYIYIRIYNIYIYTYIIYIYIILYCIQYSKTYTWGFTWVFQIHFWTSSSTQPVPSPSTATGSPKLVPSVPTPNPAGERSWETRKVMEKNGIIMGFNYYISGNNLKSWDNFWGNQQEYMGYLWDIRIICEYRMWEIFKTGLGIALKVDKVVWTCW